MTAVPALQGYTVDDLDWVRDLVGTRTVELDPWGNLVVSPASDPHEIALRVLHEQVLEVVRTWPVPVEVYVGALAWKPPGGTGYTNVPDLMVLPEGWRRGGDEGLHLDPPPLLVVEVASPSTHAIDRGRKRGDYLTGAAGGYWLVDLPGLAPVQRPTLTALERDGSRWIEHPPLTGRCSTPPPFAVELDLEALRRRGP